VKGTIKWFSENKGYGYLVDADGRERFFGVRHVHGSRLPGSGDEVNFEPGLDRNKKPIARKISIQEPARSGGDPRELCQHCNRKMTPRVVVGRPIFYIGYWTPEPKYSVCPYCAGKHKDFAPGDKPMKIIIGIIGTIFVIAVLSHLATSYYERKNRPSLHERGSINLQTPQTRPEFSERRQEFERRHQEHMERLRAD